MFLIQRIYSGAGEDGKDIRETLAMGFGDPDSALIHLKKQFNDEGVLDCNVTYNSKTKRFSIIPKERTDLLYHIVHKNEEDLIDAKDTDS